MPTGWVKSLQCKSRAYEDVYHHHHQPKKHVMANASCTKSINDVIIQTKTSTNKKPTKNTKHSHKPDPDPNIPKIRNFDPFFPALTELPDGHPSRNVVEIIFQSSWNLKTFPGRVEMIFKVQNGSKTVDRFEEYREVVKSRAARSGNGAADRASVSRCAVDGNEVMGFQCLGPARGDYDGGAWAFPGKGAAVCTFSDSRGAHEKTAGGGGGRRAMLVCRVVAGRVKKRVGYDEVMMIDGRVGFDSVSGGDNGELFVFDSRAVLSCFLIIYKL
ncbi:hypothetical protein ACFE04_014425 [Oxalis oulophora]